jgi:hypothetical protein
MALSGKWVEGRTAKRTHACLARSGRSPKATRASAQERQGRSDWRLRADEMVSYTHMQLGHPQPVPEESRHQGECALRGGPRSWML